MWVRLETKKRIVKRSFPGLLEFASLPVAQALNLVCVQACARFPEDKVNRFQWPDGICMKKMAQLPENDVMGRSHCALGHGLRYEEEVFERVSGGRRIIINLSFSNHPRNSFRFFPYLVTVWSRTVPGGGFSKAWLTLLRPKILVEMRFWTTTKLKPGE